MLSTWLDFMFMPRDFHTPATRSTEIQARRVDPVRASAPSNRRVHAMGALKSIFHAASSNRSFN